MVAKGLVTLAVLAAVVSTAVGSGSAAETTGQLVTYPAPAGQALSSAYSVRVRPVGGSWTELDEYEVTVDRDTYSKAAIVAFDTSGPVEVEVTKRAGTMRSARVRPRSLGVTSTIGSDGRTATFVLPRPLNVSFEVDGDILHNVHVFASPIEADAPAPGPGVIFFGPGRHAIAGDHVLRVPSNTTVYLAGGAVVEGSIRIVKARNVIIRGRGVIDPSRFFAPLTGATVLVDRSTDVGIRDLTLLRAQDGSITVANSSRIVVAGVREITTDASSDGIFMTASRDVLVDDVSCVPPTTRSPCTRRRRGTAREGPATSRYETRPSGPTSHTRSLSGRTGIRGPRRHRGRRRAQRRHPRARRARRRALRGALAVNAGNRVTVRDTRFDDVRIEDFSRGQVVNLKVFRNWYYNTRAGLGIEDVFFRRVRYVGTGDSPSRIRG